MQAEPEYEALRRRPTGRPLLVQSWRDLLFLHAPAEPDQIQELLPDGLSIDTFPDESGVERAWIGLVPFRMHGIRHWATPAFPYLSAFPETNVRTYVHRKGRPGVWFFSLDASRWLACKTARTLYSLPYFHCRMKTSRIGNVVAYRNSRLKEPRTSLEIEAEIGKPMATPVYGSLEFFLVERYMLYAICGGRLFTARVFHKPYNLKDAKLNTCEESSVVAATGKDWSPWKRVFFSEGVDVEVFPLQADC